MRSASGLPDTSITSGTSGGPSVGAQHVGQRRRVATALDAEPGAASRRHARGSTATTRAPARWSSSAVNAPTDAEAEHDDGLAEQRSGIQT